MFACLAVGVGGALGSIARYAVNRFVLHHWPTVQVPLATIMVNICGCLAIGVIVGAAVAGRFGPGLYWREFIIVGVLGGFTTFSSFGLETVTLLRAGASGAALINIGAQMIGGLFAVYAGLIVTEWLLATQR